MLNKFKRRQRVVVKVMERVPDPSTVNGTPYMCVEVLRYGTITAPAVGFNRWDTTKGYARVRMDSQQEYEKGYEYPHASIAPAPDSKTEFERRHYDLHGLTHDQIALLRDVLAGDMRPEAAKLLSRLPQLP